MLRISETSRGTLGGPPLLGGMSLPEPGAVKRRPTLIRLEVERKKKGPIGMSYPVKAAVRGDLTAAAIKIARVSVRVRSISWLDDYRQRS